MKKIKTIIFFLILSAVSANESIARDGLLFKPLTANPFEARVGSFYSSEEKKLRLDIGTSFDLFKFSVDSNQAAIGGDFFTYTRLRSEGNFKFPVETSDYYFGLNYSMELSLMMPSFIRFRIAHISSHLVDGYVANDTFLQKPIVYSREFIDMVYAGYWNAFRYYLGVNYVFSTIPKDPNELTPQIGFDYERTFCGWLHFVVGADFKLIGINNVWRGATAVQLGVTYYTYRNYGIFLGAYMYNGPSMHGQFYNQIDNYMGLGFQFMFL